MKVKLIASLNNVHGCSQEYTFEVDDEDVAGMSRAQIEKYLLDDYLNDILFRVVEVDFEILEMPAGSEGN